jgi:hypothetical protein
MDLRAHKQGSKIINLTLVGMFRPQTDSLSSLFCHNYSYCQLSLRAHLYLWQL